jgi:hypothetical protein
MDYSSIISELHRNNQVFTDLLSGLNKEEYLWKPAPEKWCLLEIICHLYDEEREDFRARIKHAFESPGLPFPPIDPVKWVHERKYLSQDFKSVLEKFSDERMQSVEWLNSLSSPDWNSGYNHPKFGMITAKMLLANWLEHDYLHIRQILTLKHLYLKNHSGESLLYAGTW